MLALIAAVVALPLIAIGLGLSRASMPASVLRFVPGWAFIRLDLRLFLSTALLGAVAMMLFSLLPALQAIRAQVADTLRQAGRSLTPGRNRQFLRSALATTQMALALALLFASTLALSAADRTINGRLGFDKNNVLVAQMVLPERTYENPETRRRLIATVVDNLQGIPAVSDIGVTSIIPSAFNNNSRKFYPEGVQLTEVEAKFAEYRRVTSSYFAAMRIPLLRGRLFDDSDRLDSTPVAVVSTALAHKYWGDADPIGRRFKLEANGPWLSVIGVAGNVRHNWFVQQPDAVYRPISQEAPYTVAFALRTVGDPTALAGDLRRAVAKADADQPIASLATLSQLVEERAAGLVFIARALAIVGSIALVLSLMGIYSLMAFLTTQRTQEIGVRMALGAGRWDVVRATTQRALGITVAGAVIGSALAFAAGRAMQSLLAGVISSNMTQLAGLTMLLAAVALFAAYVPARRAASIDPMAALRQP